MESEQGCAATNEESLAMIKAALAETGRWLHVNQTPAWMGRLYQSANRLAHLYFLRERCNVPTWLVNLCFTDDQRHGNTPVEQWTKGLADAKVRLGLQDTAIPHAADVLLRPWMILWTPPCVAPQSDAPVATGSPVCEAVCGFCV
jgi:hypothetical protein